MSVTVIATGRPIPRADSPCHGRHKSGVSIDHTGLRQPPHGLCAIAGERLLPSLSNQATADNGCPLLSDDSNLVQRIRNLGVRGANSGK